MIDQGSEVKTGATATDAFAGGRDRNRARDVCRHVTSRGAACADTGSDDGQDIHVGVVNRHARLRK